MTPDQLSRSGSETGHQKALFAWAAVAQNHGFAVANNWAKTGTITGQSIPVPVLRWMHAIPNGGLRDPITAAKMKAEGVKKGICDVFLPYPCGDDYGNFHSGLYVEMKKEIGGKTSPKQEEFIEYAISVGYTVRIARGWREAANAIQMYLGYT
jgi:hypothetical protein